MYIYSLALFDCIAILTLLDEIAVSLSGSVPAIRPNLRHSPSEIHCSLLPLDGLSSFMVCGVKASVLHGAGTQAVSDRTQRRYVRIVSCFGSFGTSASDRVLLRIVFSFGSCFAAIE